MIFQTDQKFFVFDCESVGLHGQTFAVAGGIYDIHGVAVEGSEFVFHCDSTHAASSCPERDEEDRLWIEGNVKIPACAVLCNNPMDVRNRFWQLWEMAKSADPNIRMIVECGWPVEARFLGECVMDEPEARNWSGPYPMHEVATLMRAAGMDPMAAYLRADSELPSHNPLGDARLSARLLSEAILKLTARRAIDLDLDDMPRIARWSRELLERAFREAVRTCGEEKTENRRLKKLLGVNQPAPAPVDASAPSKCLGLRWVPVVGNMATSFIDDHFVIQTLDAGANKPALLVLAEVRQPHQSEEMFFKPVKRTESEALEIR